MNHKGIYTSYSDLFYLNEEVGIIKMAFHHPIDLNKPYLRINQVQNNSLKHENIIIVYAINYELFGYWPNTNRLSASW
jgi:hypothetical protein